MFDRYTESARRALFFARYEVSQLGGAAIHLEHLLLGVMRRPEGAVRRILAPLPLERIRSEIESQTIIREKIPTSVEIPFSTETKRALNVAAEEADRLLHTYIGPEHLLLAVLREEKSVAAAMLAKYGLRLTDVRLQIVQLLEERSSSASTGAEASDRIDQIKRLVQQLGRTPPDTKDAHDLIQQIGDALDALRHHFET